MDGHWSITEVARLTGLTSRALRHYHAIGLLPPAATSDGGRRLYGEAELQRLQEILLLRALGLGLEAIGRALAPRGEADRIGVLRRHREHLALERDRFDRLLATVDRTIRTLEEGTTMAPDEMFDGLIHNPYEAEARATWGDAAVDASNDRLRRLGPEDRDLLTSGRGFEEVHGRLAALRAEGLSVDDARVQEAVAHHYRLIRLAWTPNREAYLGLGRMYVEDERFRKSIGGGDDALVHFLRDAMEVYAAANLGA